MGRRTEPYRVIQWATGSIGQIAIRHFASDPAYELVGAYVTSGAKHGRDAGEIAGITPLGVACTTSKEEILALDADAVNYAPLYRDIDDMCAILRSGKNIVTPIGFAYPAARDPDETARLEDACHEGGTSLHGAGIHPGFVGDLFTITASRLMTRIEKVTVTEIAPGMTFADRSYLRQAIETKTFVVGTYTKSKFTGEEVLPLAMPLLENEAVVGVVVPPCLEVRVGMDRLDLHRVERDLVGGGERGRRDHGDAFHALGKADGPLHGLHAAHRAADDGSPALDADGIGERRLRVHLVAHRRVGKTLPPLEAVGGQGCRPGRPLASADHVRRDDEPPIGVDREARPDDAAPPPGGGMPGAGFASHVAVAGQRVQHEHRVVTCVVEPSPRLVRDGRAGEGTPALERHGADADELPIADGVAVAPGTAGARLAQQRAGLRVGDEARRHGVF